MDQAVWEREFEQWLSIATEQEKREMLAVITARLASASYQERNLDRRD